MTLKRQVSMAAAAAVISLGALATPSHAAGDAPSPTTSCKRGWVWSGSLGKCVRKRSDAGQTEQLYQQGRKLAKAADYRAAIATLASADQADPRVLNYLGYSHRKMGQFDKAIAYYEAALKINPDFVLAREYLGEGFVAMGQIEYAYEQLTEIANRCGRDCEEYQKLAAVISGETATW